MERISFTYCFAAMLAGILTCATLGMVPALLVATGMGCLYLIVLEFKGWL